jgi:hypothetical protein
MRAYLHLWGDLGSHLDSSLLSLHKRIVRMCSVWLVTSSEPSKVRTRPSIQFHELTCTLGMTLLATLKETLVAAFLACVDE